MAWQEVSTDVGPKVGRVKYSVAMKHGGARISVPKHVADALGWKKATTFRLLVGGGDTEGKLKIEPHDKGVIVSKTPPRSDGFIVRLGRWPGLAPRDVDGIVVEHEVAGDALIIALPQHARMVAPSPPAAPSSRYSVPVISKTDVSSKFFNDPKPKVIAPASGVRR